MTFTHQIESLKMFDDGTIRLSEGPWSSPIWIAPKNKHASGKTKWRIVIYYRKDNAKTYRRSVFNAEYRILDKLRRCQYFFYFRFGFRIFYQMQMYPNSIDKIATTIR